MVILHVNPRALSRWRLRIEPDSLPEGWTSSEVEVEIESGSSTDGIEISLEPPPAPAPTDEEAAKTQ